MKTTLTIIGTTNTEVNRAVSLLRHLGVPVPNVTLPTNTSGDEVSFEITSQPWMVNRVIDSLNSHFTVSNVRASIGVRPTMESINKDEMTGKYVMVNFTGVLVMARISKITEDRYTYNFFYEFTVPSQVNWGENGYRKSVDTFRKIDGKMLGTLIFLN